jgi:hypothetical protein
VLACPNSHRPHRMKFVGAPRVAHRVGRYVAWRRPPPWTTLHCCEPPELHLSFGESCSNKPSHFYPQVSRALQCGQSSKEVRVDSAHFIRPAGVGFKKFWQVLHSRYIVVKWLKCYRPCSRRRSRKMRFDIPVSTTLRKISTIKQRGTTGASRPASSGANPADSKTSGSCVHLQSTQPGSIQVKHANTGDEPTHQHQQHFGGQMPGHEGRKWCGDQTTQRQSRDQNPHRLIQNRQE